MEKVRIGIVGVGAISGIYLQNITGMFHEIEVAGICDLVREKAENAAAQYPGIKIYETMYDVFADPEVDIVLNLTRPYEHYGVTSEALKAGKHVYSEKPLAATLEEGRALVELARGKGLMLGGAPVHGRGHPDLPAADRRRLHRPSDRRGCQHDLPWT